MQSIRRGLDEIAGPDPKLVAQVNSIDTTLRDINDQINGDPILRRANEPSQPSPHCMLSLFIPPLRPESSAGGNV